MGGLFGVVSKESCVQDLFFGTDYHSHLGTKRGGMATICRGTFQRFIHSIENAQFRSKFENDVEKLEGVMGIGCISDTEDQPLIITSHMGTFSIVTVGRINNLEALVREMFKQNRTHFSDMSEGQINPSEVVSALVSQGQNYAEGIRMAQERIDGSCTLLLMTENEIFGARDLKGRTPLIVGKKPGGFCLTMETCALPNLMYEAYHELGPGEIVRVTAEGIEQQMPPLDEMRICAFLWVYYGYPASSYEGINVEIMRNRSGEILADRDSVSVDLVCGIPDSGVAHALGYSNRSGIPYGRPFVKYTPTWPRSFMPQNQSVRDMVARMKLIPVTAMIHDQRLLFCEDSIVRGTQLRETVRRLFDNGAREVHMRPACPPLVYGCRFLNFSRSRSEMDLAARQAIKTLEGDMDKNPDRYTDSGSPAYQVLVDEIRKKLGLTSLMYQRLEDMITAIGLPAEKLCTYCWNGKG